LELESSAQIRRKRTKTAEFADQWCFSIRKLSSPFKVSPSLPACPATNRRKKVANKEQFYAMPQCFIQTTNNLINRRINCYYGKHAKTKPGICNRQGEGDTAAIAVTKKKKNERNTRKKSFSSMCAPRFVVRRVNNVAIFSFLSKTVRTRFCFYVLVSAWSIVTRSRIKFR
jgi:hypothetical protein